MILCEKPPKRSKVGCERATQMITFLQAGDLANATGVAGTGVSASASYLPILLFLVVAAAFPGVALFVLRIIRPSVYDEQKMMPYECGVDPTLDARERFSVRFYIIAMLFLIFDVETVFLLPWAIAFDKLAVFGLIEMLVFVGILVVGFYYAWRKGVLNWA